MLAPNRIAVYLTALAGLATALAPAVANFDVQSTVGIVGGLAGIVLVVRKWLDGWQAYEQQTAREQLARDTREGTTYSRPVTKT